ncbi:hypothetical protein C1H46_006021 [Malus baccata]|uniref:Uncharacterized protein n=1 Tax=Malus baccata TaxID=106549 RepID=A0A540NCS1_MALBA|nr:hypothetical protein C1H46_006021 [Malus baccata]
MDDKFVDAQKDHQGQEDSLHRLNEEQELSGEGTLSSSGSKLKRLVTWSNPQHALITNVKRLQISKCCIKGSLFQSGIGLDSSIPKHILSLDEKFCQKCMELIHISASKVARCNTAVKLSSSTISALPERLNVAESRSGDTCSSARFVIECPLAAEGGSVVISPAGQWIVGRVMGSKSMTNILKFHQFWPLGSNTDLRRIDCNNDKGSICYDFTDSPGGFSFSSSPMLEKETPIKGSHKSESNAGHKRLISICSTNSALSDQSSASTLATVSRGMLQCTWKGGNPHFVFSTDEQREVYVANMWKVESEEDKTLDYIYLFHSGKGGQRDHEIRDGESHLVGKMKVNNLVSLCPSNSKIMETEFILFGGGIEMHTSSHNLRQSKGLSKKVVEAFRTTHSSKQRTISKLSGPCFIVENPSQEPCLDTGNNQDALRVPNFLTERWRSGGQCDCGGWDLGCPLTVLKTKSSREDILPQSDTQGECKSFELNRTGSEHGPPAWRMLNVHDDLYFVHFQPSLSVLQSFAIAVAIIHTQSPALRPKCTGILSTKVQGLKTM